MASASESWSATSANYSQKLVQVTSQGGEALLQLVEPLKALEATSVVLDNGAGSGALTGLLCQRSSAMQVVAADIAPGMLTQLEKRSLPNVQTMILDATKDYVSQGLRPDQFSHVLSSFMIQFVHPPQTVIDESYRVLAPGGVIGYAIWSVSQIPEPWNMACSNLDPSYQPNDKIFADAFKTMEDLEAAYTKAGFRDVHSSETQLCLDFDSAESFADYFIFSKHPPFMMLMSAWKRKPEDVRDELVKVTREHFENGKIYMTAACSVARK